MPVIVRRDSIVPSDLRGRGTSFHLLGTEVGTPDLKINVNTINPGTGPGPFHYHSNAINAFVVVDGEALVRFVDGEVQLGAGDAAYFDRGESHSIENHGLVPLTVVEVKAPSDSDFVVNDEGR